MWKPRAARRPFERGDTTDTEKIWQEVKAASKTSVHHSMGTGRMFLKSNTPHCPKGWCGLCFIGIIATIFAL